MGSVVAFIPPPKARHRLALRESRHLAPREWPTPRVPRRQRNLLADLDAFAHCIGFLLLLACSWLPFILLALKLFSYLHITH